MIEIEKPNISTVNLSEDGRSGKFIVEPLERGYGVTLGNSLRRVLLSSLPGVAVSSIKIDGVLHEISTIPGVKEDVTEIVLNVKGITAKLYTNSPKTVVIDVTGACDVTAGDIKHDADIEILFDCIHKKLSTAIRVGSVEFIPATSGNFHISVTHKRGKENLVCSAVYGNEDHSIRASALVKSTSVRTDNKHILDIAFVE